MKPRKEVTYETIKTWKEDGKLKRRIERTTYPSRDKETIISPLLWFAMGLFAMAVLRALILME